MAVSSSRARARLRLVASLPLLAPLRCVSLRRFGRCLHLLPLSVKRSEMRAPRLLCALTLVLLLGAYAALGAKPSSRTTDTDTDTVVATQHAACSVLLVSIPLRGHMMPLVGIGEALVERGCNVSIVVPRVRGARVCVCVGTRTALIDTYLSTLLSLTQCVCDSHGSCGSKAPSSIRSRSLTATRST